MRYDVAEANQYAPVVERGFTFTVEDQDTAFTVIRMTKLPEQTTIVRFELGPDAIRVECPCHPVYQKRGYFLIVSQWDAAQGACVLTINGTDEQGHTKPYELWQLSLTAIEHLIFPQP